MSNIVKETKESAIRTLRTLLTVNADEALAIGKTAFKDGPSGLASRGIALIQRWNYVRFGQAFLNELEEMKEAGEIREDLHNTDAGVSSVEEFFELIDGKPDRERFEAFCALFMDANAPDADENEAILDLELMGILRGLTAGEMHLLRAFLKIGSYSVGGPTLEELLAREMGYRSDALMRRNLHSLVQNSLVDDGNIQNRGGSHNQEKFLLTDLGAALRSRIDRYNNFKAERKTNT